MSRPGSDIALSRKLTPNTGQLSDRRRSAYAVRVWTDDDLRALQSFLLVLPEAGDLIRSGSGLRKLRWSAQGRGKRGGARVIYYWYKPKHHVYLIYGYVKSEREDLTPQQIRTLAELMKDVKDG